MTKSIGDITTIAAYERPLKKGRSEVRPCLTFDPISPDPLPLSTRSVAPYKKLNVDLWKHTFAFLGFSSWSALFFTCKIFRAAYHTFPFEYLIFNHDFQDRPKWMPAIVTKMISDREFPTVKLVRGNLSTKQLTILFEKCVNLEILDLSGTWYPINLAKFPTTLKSLCLSNCTKIQKADLAKQWPKFTQLESLRVSDTSFNLGCLKSIASTLTSLNLSGNKEMKGFNFSKFVALRELTISYTTSDNAVLATLPAKTLTFLDISFTSINAYGDLERLKNLKTLLAYESTLTDEQVEQLKRAIPELYIDHTVLDPTQPTDWDL